MRKETMTVAIIGVAALMLIGGAGYFTFFNKSRPVPASNGSGGQLSSTDLKGDLNRDGSVDVEDADLIRKSSPCNHVDPCWKKVAGKTKDGDNPIYVSDLDINHDDNVNELDTSAMSSD